MYEKQSEGILSLLLITAMGISTLSAQTKKEREKELKKQVETGYIREV